MVLPGIESALARRLFSGKCSRGGRARGTVCKCMWEPKAGKKGEVKAEWVVLCHGSAARGRRSGLMGSENGAGPVQEGGRCKRNPAGPFQKWSTIECECWRSIKVADFIVSPLARNLVIIVLNGTAGKRKACKGSDVSAVLTN